MKWPWAREKRSTSYTDLIVAGLVAKTGDSSTSDLLASVEMAAGLWERSLAAGKSSELTSSQLGLIGRQLLLTGESCWWKSRASGLWPVSQWDIKGTSPAQSRWTYRLTLDGPGGTITKNASSSQVLHVRIGVNPSRLWEGSSPLARSQATRDALKQVERSLKQEHAGPTGSVLPAPDPEDSNLKDALLKLQGKVLLVEQSELGLAGEGHAGRTTWTPKRLGPDPSEGTLTAREQLQRSLLTAAGLPPSMVAPSTANSAREGLRQFLWLTINPVVSLISEELERVGLDPAIDMSDLNASDLAGRARALGQMTKAGVPLPDARRLTGLS